MLDLAVLDELACDVLDGVDRDGEADADVAAGLALDLGVHADHVAVRVQKRTAGVAVVDGRVGLDGLVDLEAVRRLDPPLQRADDAGGDRPLEPEGIADGDDGVPDLDGARAPES